MSAGTIATSRAPGGADSPGSGERASVEERYQSLLVIGRGGMGTVEVALERGEGGFQRIVALKRMLPETSSNARQKEMFLREARLAALLDHPNVVHAFALGELRGELYLAMEYVEGEPLTRILQAAREKEGGLVPALVAHILAEICDGLHAAHELRDVRNMPLNVVHRDVSPHNVMISYEGHVKLLDFGVAKFDAGQAMTRTGEIKGKMGYMSPEQAMGEAHDRRSDLWSIGAVLYECISGRRMWGDGTDLEVMRKLALEEPPSLDLHPNAPKPLADLYARLVARTAAERPPTARAVAEELREYVASSGTRPDARVVRAVMMRLFAREAERQRTALSDALERAAPSHVEELRRSLEPRAGMSSNDVRGDPGTRSTRPDPITVDTGEGAVAVPRRRRGLVIAALVAALAVGGAIALRDRATSIAKMPSAPPMTTASMTTATATAIATATSTPTTIATATAMPTSTSTERAAAGLRPPPLLSTASASARSPAAATFLPTAAPSATTSAPKPNASSKPPPDVDPTPF